MYKLSSVFLLLAAASISTTAFASTGTIASGYGAKNITMGGASIALPYDSMAAANNPAGMAKVGTRTDLSLRYFKGTAHNTYGSVDNKNSINMTTLVPEGGANYQIDDDWTFGLTMYGGGFSSEYKKPIIPALGLDKFRGSLAILTLAPTFTYKVRPDLYVGLSINYNYAIIDPQGVPGLDTEKQTAHGWGYKLGVLWEPVNDWTFGVAYSPKSKLSKFNGYEDNLLASSDGHYESVEHFALGTAWKVTPQLTLALDYLRYNWENVDFFNKESGSGYRNQNVWRVGVAYDVTERFSVQAGYSHANDFVTSDYTLGSYIGPAISARSWSAGASYSFDGGYEVTAGIERHIPRSLKGTGPSEGTNLDVDYGFLVFGLSKKF